MSENEAGKGVFEIEAEKLAEKAELQAEVKRLLARVQELEEQKSDA